VWATELVWTKRVEEKSFASAGDKTPIAQSVLIAIILYTTLHHINSSEQKRKRKNLTDLY
jgi:transposase